MLSFHLQYSKRPKSLKSVTRIKNFFQKFQSVFNLPSVQMDRFFYKLEHLELQLLHTCYLSQELDQESSIEQLKSELEGLDRAYSDSKEQVARCEDMVSQLTQELEAGQKELSLTLSHVTELEDTGRQLRDKVKEAQQEVGRG